MRRTLLGLWSIYLGTEPKYRLCVGNTEVALDVFRGMTGHSMPNSNYVSLLAVVMDKTYNTFLSILNHKRLFFFLNVSRLTWRSLFT